MGNVQSQGDDAEQEDEDVIRLKGTQSTVRFSVSPTNVRMVE